jgi:hypothetical protein
MLAFFLALGLAVQPLRAQTPVRPGFPPALPRAEFSGLLQRAVDQLYMKGFRHLGDERDFDHGHILFDAAGRPLAILYHTQELALDQPRGGEFAYLNPDGRNWIQWLSDGRVENAARYRRKAYPNSPFWDLFQLSELPDLERNHTILDKMLDPALVPLDVSRTKQWVFTRVSCGSAPDDLRVLLPTREAVCLALSET